MDSKEVSKDSIQSSDTIGTGGHMEKKQKEEEERKKINARIITDMRYRGERIPQRKKKSVRDRYTRGEENVIYAVFK